MGERTFDGEIVLARLRELPGGSELLELAAGGDEVELVGGAVRDLLLGRTPRELDVVVASDAHGFARALASRLDTFAATDQHERFGTALVRWQAGCIDIATRRSESYFAPGALPDVRGGTPEEDLLRRDFTVNAIAVPLLGPARGTLRAPAHALDDLAGGRLRVLYEQSFLDDPTRLLRLARYVARLGFEIEDHTAELALQAIAAGALESVSGARIGAELRLALSEPDAVGALAAMAQLGLLAAVHPRLSFERQLAERALALLPADGRRDLLLLGALTVRPLGDDPRQEIAGLLDRLQFPAGDRDRTAAAVAAVPRLAAELAAAVRPSRLRAAVGGTPPEGIALAGAVSESAAEPARRWLTELRDVRLQIDGNDLRAAGIPEGPEVGRRLEAALCRRLDGELESGRAAELAAALEAS